MANTEKMVRFVRGRRSNKDSRRKRVEELVVKKKVRMKHACVLIYAGMEWEIIYRKEGERMKSIRIQVSKYDQWGMVC